MTLSKDDIMYLDIATTVSKRSRDKLYKVGAVIAKDNKILSYGWNGTPHGMDNQTRDFNGKTKWELVHAETNAIAKLAASTSSSEGATLYLTHSPCKECTKLILQSGIKRLVFRYVYESWGLGIDKANNPNVRSPENEALDLLREYGVDVAQYRD